MCSARYRLAKPSRKRKFVMPAPERHSRPDARPDLPFEVVGLGESMVVIMPTDPVPIEAAEYFVARVGGAESNVAMFLAELGHRAAWLSRVGNDPFGRILLRHLADGGVDIGAVVTDDSTPTGVYFKDPQPERTDVYYYRVGSAASCLDPTVLQSPVLAGAGVLHLSGITPALSPGCRRLIERAVFDRPLGETLVSFDVNFRPALWTGDTPGPVLRELANAADLVFVGLDEAERLWDVSEPCAVRALLPDPTTVVVKDGAVGATVVTRDGEMVFEPALRVRVVEPVGAGDAFAAGYISAYLRGRPEQQRLRMGHLVAAHALAVTTDHTTLPQPTWFESHLVATAQQWSGFEFGSLSGLGG
ncbi:MAG TPA: sugar kinase [Jatrophihabitans sp.]|nr:sugar kinase [Jatrophihabitans sp.]